MTSQQADRDDRIFQFWTQQATEHGTDPAASWSDTRVIELEIAAIKERIPRPATVADIGCANGFSTVAYASLEDVTLVGVDYVSEMVEAATKRHAELPSTMAERLRFQTGDARALDFPDGSFDCVISTRVIINLGNWEGQKCGLDEYARILRSGGTLLLSEATIDGWENLNRLRHDFALPAIGVPEFNAYLDVGQVIEHLAPVLDLVELVDFASSYYVATRLLKPLLAFALNRPSEFVLDPDTEFNRFAASLPPVGDYGVQKLFIFQKR